MGHAQLGITNKFKLNHKSRSRKKKPYFMHFRIPQTCADSRTVFINYAQKNPTNVQPLKNI